MNILSPIAVDSPAAGLLTFGHFFVFFVTVGFTRNLQFFIEDWVKDFDTTVATAGWVASCAYAVPPFFCPVATIVTTWVDQRLVIAMGGSVAAGCFFIGAIAPSIGALIIAVGVANIGKAFVFQTSCVALANATKKLRPVATGFASLGMTVAGIVMPHLLVLARNAGGGSPSGWRTGFMLFGAMLFVIPFISIIMRPVILDEKMDSNGQASKGILETYMKTTWKSLFLYWGGALNLFVWRHRIYPLFILYIVFHFGAFISPTIFAAPYIEINVEETMRNLTYPSLLPITEIYQSGNSSRSAEVLTFFAVGDLAGTIIYSLLMNIPHRLVEENRFYFFIINEMIPVITNAIIPYVKSYGGLIASFTITGFHFGGWSVIFWTVLADIYGSDLGAATSWIFVACGLSGLAVPNILSKIMESTSASVKPSSRDYGIIWAGISVSHSIALLILIIMAVIIQRKKVTTRRLMKKLCTYEPTNSQKR